MEYLEKYEYWRTSNTFDDATHQELENIKEDENEIKERFRVWNRRFTWSNRCRNK